MTRFLALMATLALAACGLETATTAATVGVAKTKELEAARQTQERALQQIDQAMKAGTARLEKAEAANQ